MIKINVCNKFYNKGRPNQNHVLRDVTLTLPEKGMVAIFGRSGCGKTTLLNIIGGLDTADSGSVMVGTSAISPDKDEVRNREVGYIFQNYNLNPDETCAENIADALRLCGMRDEDEIEDRVMSSLRAVGLEKYAKRYPGTLSGGQKQRVAIARAIVKAPALILADEPTGNLDEQNTVMIMQLLRRIANERLVLLVTHEANLVDFYCDSVINLADGQVMSVRENENVGTYVARNKNHIYLGEYDKTTESVGGITVDAYGEINPEDIKLTVVSADGKLFLRVDSPGVHIIGSDGETQMHDGVFEEVEKKEAGAAEMDLSALTAFEGKHFGALFSFASSVKSGYRSLFGKKDRVKGKKRRGGQKFMRLCMFVFAAVFVFMTAFFATGIGSVERAERDINPNLIFISLNEDEGALLSYDELYASGVDAVEVMKYKNYSHTISLDGGSFETYKAGIYDTSNDLTTAFLPHSLISGARVIAGNTDSLGDDTIVISRALADRILEASTVSYISEYSDLIDMNVDQYMIVNTLGNTKIAAVVEGGEVAAYFSDVSLAKYMYLTQSDIGIVRASDYNLDVADGEVYIGRTYVTLDHKINTETATIRGQQLSVLSVATGQQDFIEYFPWSQRNSVVRSPSDVFYKECIARDYPELEMGTDEYQEMFNQAEELYWCEWLLYYYSDIEAYCRDLVLSGCTKDEVKIYAWGCDEMVYVLDNYHRWGGYIDGSVSTGEIIYALEKYFEETGKYPKMSELSTNESLLKYRAQLGEIVEDAREKFYVYQLNNWGDYYGSSSYATAYVSDADYIKLSRSVGKTDKYFYPEYYIYKDGMAVEDILVLHTTDAEATEAYLRELYPYLEDDETVEGNTFKLVTPALRAASVRTDGKDMLWASVVSLSFCFGLMCLCIYFIMRSSLLSRINEIGIYRAIGVSKKNLVYRFAVESGVLTALTVLLGYITASLLLMFVITNAGSLASEFVYYPWPIAAGVLVVLVGGSIFFGILPVLTLLGKTPAQIIAKYDI